MLHTDFSPLFCACVLILTLHFFPLGELSCTEVIPDRMLNDALDVLSIETGIVFRAARYITIICGDHPPKCEQSLLNFRDFKLWLFVLVIECMTAISEASPSNGCNASSVIRISPGFRMLPVVPPPLVHNPFMFQARDNEKSRNFFADDDMEQLLQ